MFIAVEGIDGSGKSTTIREIKRYLESKGEAVYLTAEPTTLATGKIVRNFLSETNSDTPLIHEMLALAFAADRINHLREEIWPALRKKQTVITDRYFFSSVAYQSLNVSYEWVKGINRFATLPDVLVFIDVSVDKAVERLTKFRTSTEIYEKRDLLQQIDRNYREVIKEFEENLKVIYLNGNLDIDKIYSDVEEKFAPLFADKK
ncbi:dTMP kinase [bacterium]|nr:dTMP kinase [bacterium]